MKFFYTLSEEDKKALAASSAKNLKASDFPESLEIYALEDAKGVAWCSGKVAGKDRSGIGLRYASRPALKEVVDAMISHKAAERAAQAARFASDFPAQRKALWNTLQMAEARWHGLHNAAIAAFARGAAKQHVDESEMDQARQALAEFDREHPEVIAAMKANRTAEVDQMVAQGF